MTRSINIALCAILAAALVPAQISEAEARKQERRASSPGGIPTIARSDLSVHYHTISNPRTDIGDILRAVQSMHGRSFFVDDLPKYGKPLKNLFIVGNSIAVFETKARAMAILDELPALEKAATPPARPTRGRGGSGSSAEPLVTAHLRPEHIHVSNLHQVLRAYMRNVPPPGDVWNTGQLVPNIVMHDDSNTVIIRDTAETIQLVKETITQIDVPRGRRQPSNPVTFTFHIIRAATGKQEHDLPGELTGNLKALVGFEDFQDLGTSVLRARGDSREVQAELTLDDGHRASLTLKGVSSEGKQIGIQNVRFQITGTARSEKHMIETSTSVTMGEYTVLGAFGKLPYFLVIRASSAQ